MGWSSLNLKIPVKEFFNQNLNKEFYEVVGIAVVKLNTLYAAIKHKDTNETFCIIWYINWQKGYYNFTFKSMSEFAGPQVYDCPEKIIKLLSPLNDDNDPNGYARNWRLKVLTYHNIKKHFNNGGIIKSLNPINFSDGNTYQYFKKTNKKYQAGNLIDDNINFTINIHKIKLNNNFKTILL